MGVGHVQIETQYNVLRFHIEAFFAVRFSCRRELQLEPRGGKEQSVWEKTREFCRRVSRIKTAESMQSVSRSSQKYRTGLQDKSSKPRAKKVTKKYENHGIAQQFRLAGTSGGALPLKAGPAPKAEQVAQCPVA